MPPTQNLRIQKIVSAFDHLSIDALLVTNDTDIRYLTGYRSSDSWLLVCRKKTYYVTDMRYYREVQKKLPQIEVRVFLKSISDTLFKITKVHKVRRIGIDERHVTLFEYRRLCEKCPQESKLVTTNGIVEDLREIKEKKEIRKIKEALKIHKQAIQFLRKTIRPQMSEKDIGEKLEKFVKSKGATFSFDPIIASGPNSSYPHARISSRKVKRNDSVLVDMGIDLDGYKSDLTRMFFLGKISNLIQEINSRVGEAQARAISEIKPGIPISEIDLEARNHLKKNRLAKYFVHALGHGIGLDVHESPRLSQDNLSVLKEGMVITIEPAVYIPGKIGIRIEDMVLVTPNGCEVLSDDIH